MDGASGYRIDRRYAPIFKVIKVFDRLFIAGKEKIDQLEGYKNVTVGRELRIIGLKKKIKELEEKL